MSVESVSLVLNHSRASGTAKLVLIGIANHDGDGGAWPSIATLARYANTSERSVQRALEQLVKLGEVVVHTNAGGTHGTRGDRRPNRYEIRVERAVDNASDGVTNLSPRTGHGVTLVTSRGDAGVVHGVTPASPEPSLNHPRTTPASQQQLDALTRLLADDGVEGAEAVERVVRISADAGSDTPVGRLVKVARHRRECVELYRHEQAVARRQALDAEPRCAECGRPESTCRAAEARTRASDRHDFVPADQTSRRRSA